MGDTVDLTTYSSIVTNQISKDTFYSINSNSFWVRVVSENPIFIRLTETPRSTVIPFYEINIGCNNNTFSNITKNRDGTIKAGANTPNILSDIELRGFSIRFCNKIISVCRENETTPFLQCTDETLPTFRFISFGNKPLQMRAMPTTASWIFEVPPSIRAIGKGPQKYGQVRWERFLDGKLPADAFIGAVDECPIYVARGEHRRTITPGLYAECLPHALISWGGHAHPKHDFEVLCGYNASWQLTTGDDPVPPNAIPGGHEDGYTLYIVRARFDGHVRVGKMHPRWRIGYISYKRREIELKSFEILVTHTPAIMGGPISVSRYESDSEDDSFELDWADD